MRFSLLIPILTLVSCRSEDFDPFTECLVPDLNIACTNRCEDISVECIANCDPGDSACWSQCMREIGQCYNDCPCELNCLDGCEDCANPVCDCQVTEENSQWNRCIDDNSLKLGRCVYACNDNQECEDDCLARFKTRQQNCPCEDVKCEIKENCSAGCPCSDFDCDSTSTPSTTSTTEVTTPTVRDTTTASITKTTSALPAGDAVLVLSTRNSYNKPFIVDFNGTVNEDLTFQYGEDIDVENGCGTTFKNEFWYFGSYKVSKIVGCTLEYQQDMRSGFYGGACNTFSHPDLRVLLCFGSSNNQDCSTFDGENFGSAGSSMYSHQYTLVIADYKQQALTTGCYDSSRCYIKTEVMDMQTLTWRSGPDYPFSSSKIYAYSTASTPEAAYIIGGWNTRSTIAEFKNESWRKLGSLQKGRAYHGSITVDNETMIIGGHISSSNGDAETEVWNLTNESHKMISPTLYSDEYGHGIALYVVPFNFCTS